MKRSSNAVVEPNDENNFLHKVLWANTQVSKLHKAFESNSSANKNYQKLNYIKKDN